MAYKLIYTKSSVKDIKKLDVVTKKRLKKRIEEFIKDPKKYAKKLIDSRLGDYRWRIGNYRVVFDLDGKNVVILRIRHRKEVYR